jgi:hypothetical protein
MKGRELFVFWVSAAWMAQTLPPEMGLWRPEKQTVRSQGQLPEH